MAQGYARIDSRLDTAKIGSAGRVEVHRVRLLAVIGVRKTFPHGLGHFQTSSRVPARSVDPSTTDMSRHERKSVDPSKSLLRASYLYQQLCSILGRE